VDVCARTHHDPLGYVHLAYPWETEDLPYPGPHEWQAEQLAQLGEDLRKPVEDGVHVVRFATASGHGVGKSALCSWLADWAMSTHPRCRGRVTSNTESQLKITFGGELAKWRKLSLTRDWFKLKALSMFSESDAKNWRLDLTPWSEQRPESIAGLHNRGNRIIMMFDEASNIPRTIWETASGALTDEDTEIMWLVFGNPTQPSGAFRDCFYSQRNLWRHFHIDSRDVPGTNKKLFDEWAEVYGDDSDFFRVRVKGVFPRQAPTQFISTEAVVEAKRREPECTIEDPVIAGVDCAREGRAQSVIYTRQGRDGVSIAPLILPDTRDSDRFAARIAQYLQDVKPDACFIDGGGIGGPICDRLKGLGWDVVEVKFGGSADNDIRYSNKRAEMWSRMKEWLEIGSIWDNRTEDLEKELTALEGWMDRKDRVLLESKESLLKRGEASPDIADALALTFAYPVTTRRGSSLNRFAQAKRQAVTEWKAF
jgi:hypothetical protein